MGSRADGASSKTTVAGGVACITPSTHRGCIRSHRLDLFRGAVQDLLYLLHLLDRSRRTFGRINGGAHVLEPAVNLHHRLAEDAVRELGDPREDVVDQGLVLGQMRAAL